MPSADTLLADACDSKIACLNERDLLIVIAQSLAASIEKTAEELQQEACADGIACLGYRDLLIVIAQQLSGDSPDVACVITTTDLPDGTDGEVYSEQILADQVGVTFTVISGALPDGLTLNPDGTITGTPTLPNPYTFTVQGTPMDGLPCTKEFTITVIPDEPPVFEPPELANLVVWLKPETLDALANNDPVVLWPDSGINGNDFTDAGTGTEPTYETAQLNGFAGVRFDGINDRMLSATVGTTNTDYTIFVVLKFNAATGTEGVMRVGDLTGGYGFYKDTGNRGVIHRAVAACTDAACTTNAEMWSAVRTSGPNLLRFFVNGSSLAISNSASAVNAPDGAAMHLGIFATAAALFFAGQIFEMFIYETPLSDADRQTVENYLIAKYAL